MICRNIAFDKETEEFVCQYAKENGLMKGDNINFSLAVRNLILIEAKAAYEIKEVRYDGSKFMKK